MCFHWTVTHFCGSQIYCMLLHSHKNYFSCLRHFFVTLSVDIHTRFNSNPASLKQIIRILPWYHYSKNYHANTNSIRDILQWWHWNNWIGAQLCAWSPQYIRDLTAMVIMDAAAESKSNYLNGKHKHVWCSNTFKA